MAVYQYRLHSKLDNSLKAAGYVNETDVDANIVGALILRAYSSLREVELDLCEVPDILAGTKPHFA